MKVHVSGSSTGSGDTITSTISYQDQFNNIGSDSISVSVVANQAPTATFSEIGANMTASISIWSVRCKWTTIQRLHYA